VLLAASTNHLSDQLIAALEALVVAGVTALVVNWLLRRLFDHLIDRLPGDRAAIQTRWRTLRRVTVAVILFVGIVAALTNFEATTSIARALLASSALLALVVGLAAQPTLSNMVSGILLSLNQPIRLGDRISVDGQSGVVEEIGLSHTSIRADDGRRVIYPNSVLAGKPIENATIGGGRGRAIVRVPAPAGTDAEALCDRLVSLAAESGFDEPEAVVAELTGDGATIEVRGWTSDWLGARTAEERLRAAAVAERAGEPT